MAEKRSKNFEKYVAGITDINGQTKPDNVSPQVWENHLAKQVGQLQIDLEIPEDERGEAMDKACQDMLLMDVMVDLPGF